MLTTFRAKLLVVFGAALLALLAALVSSAWMGVQQTRELDRVQRRLLPRAELAPRIEAELERLSRSMQDAVVALDPSTLDGASEHKTELFRLLTSAGDAIEPAQAAAVRWAVQDYYETALDVSRRLIAGESEGALATQVLRMQAQQRRARELALQATRVDRAELDRSFRAVREINAHADRLRFGITATSATLIALLAFWGSSAVLQSLANLTSGLSRFGTGDFSSPIPVRTRDELGRVAEQANSMASSLARLSLARDQADWLKASLSGLNDHLRGELEPSAVAERALAYLAERVEALAGAFYVREDDGRLRALSLYGGERGDSESLKVVASGAGLLGQALRSDTLRVVDDLPSGYLQIHSGLGRAEPKQLLLLPLLHSDRRVGVIELALLRPLSAGGRELLSSVQALIGVALEAARSGAARERLLLETQALAERLTAQEEELRLNNQELLSQQEELRLANEELLRQRVELAEQNRELELARSVLTDKASELNKVSAYKSQFLANMSHELRTPLNSMLLLSQLLADNDAGNLAPKQVEHLRTIHAAGQDLLSLINEVLDLSKIEAGKQEASLESVELSHFVAFARRLFEASAAQKGVALVTSLAADLPACIVTDRQRVERILTNLLGNALKFTHRGQVELSIGRPAGDAAAAAKAPSVAFVVADTGIGIPEAARERVFVAFEQAQGQTNRGYGGTGLGLPIARESARLLGGDLLLLESTSAGSRFACVLPEQAPQALKQQAPRRRVDDDAAAISPREPHLLVIEDDSVQAEQLVAIAHARGLKVVVVGSGADGLQAARRDRPIGIILDVKLPDMDGWSLMEQLKQDERTRSIPVHFVSGLEQPERGLALGAVGYLVKPASHAELSAMVRRLVPINRRGDAVLVVEDDARQGGSLLEVLRQAGFSGEHVQTAAAALQALESGHFGCLILDLGLPDMDGLGLLQTLRERPRIAAPRVLIHTGRSLSKQETRELEAYAEAIVLKDGNSAERLLEEVRLFLRHVTHTNSLPPGGEQARTDVTLNGVKLLLAEDDMRTVYSLSALLRSRGAEVVTAETGREALDALSMHPDVRAVLMDVMMPELDGYEAIRRLRRDPRFAQLPVIALTAKAMKGERERCLEAGASEYLPKPVEAEKLLSTLRGFLLAEAG